MPQKDTSLSWEVDGQQIIISNPDKVYWPEEGYTKLDCLHYYQEMAAIMLPHLQQRPTTLHYFPHGINDFSFYKRDFSKVTGYPLHTVTYEEVSQDKSIQVLLIDKLADMLWLTSKGAIEYHLWSATVPRLNQPDRAIFDLDISTKTTFDTLLTAATYLHELLQELGIRGLVKTSGGSGLHVVVPIKPIYTYEEVRDWVKQLGNQLAQKHPDLITTKTLSGKTHQGDKITVDYLQNVISRNTAAPYTLRGKPGAPVSTPLSWEEVAKGGFTPTDFNIKTIPQRVQQQGDLFAPVFSDAQTLPI